MTQQSHNYYFFPYQNISKYLGVLLENIDLKIS
jgi:hypothetical protein